MGSASYRRGSNHMHLVVKHKRTGTFNKERKFHPYKPLIRLQRVTKLPYICYRRLVDTLIVVYGTITGRYFVPCWISGPPSI